MNMAPPNANISAIKLALLAKQTRMKAGQILRSDPIAVIGVGCRVPGGAASADEMWSLLCAGAHTEREVPADRWNFRDWYDPDPAVPGKSVAKEASFIEDIDMFDSGYFGILPREADRMDPQQRLVLEVAIEAVDNAGLPHRLLRGSSTAVYIASYHNDYAQLQYNDPLGIDARTLTGAVHSVVPNRLSYLLDLRGPSISVDSACSSSLSAIHLACQGLRSGETSLAIAGGVSLMIAPELAVAMSKVGFMAPDGLCKTFDALADGFGRGEGCGIVVLKRLSDAIAENDRIHAVIRGSAVNQDGRSTLLAAPNGPAQEALLRESLHTAQLDAGRICFFETHGTGTALGDPIEVEAIAATIGQLAESDAPCWLGSAKANFGHMEAAAGVIGLIKAIQVLRHGQVPPQPHFTELNPHISLEGTRLAVPKELTALPGGAYPRCAAVSSFGIGGTNANVILEEAPNLAVAARTVSPDTCRILPLSARSPAALEALVKSWTTFVGETPATIDDLCSTAARRRTHYDCRLAVTAHSKDELRAQLLALSTNPLPIRGGATPRIGFVFCGQGPQWFAMGRELLETEVIFRDIITSCDQLLRPLALWSLLDELNLPEERSRLAQTEVAQPALFAIQVGLAALWKSWGVSPDCVVGHSIGEIAALHVAGALDLPEAIRVVFHRARIMQRATGNGRMAAVSVNEEEAARVVAPYGARLGIGAVNGPRSVVLSGETAALEEVVASLQKRDVNCRMLPVNYAFHSAQMAALRDEFVAELGQVRATEPLIEFISTVSGRSEAGRPDASYFGRNVGDPVRFAAAATEMLRECNLVVEIGPHPVLAAAIAECVAPEQPAPSIFPSLRRGRPDRETMLKACAGVYAAGHDINWENVQVEPWQIVDLPSYPWQRRRHWLPTRQGHALPLKGAERFASVKLSSLRAPVEGVEDLYRVGWVPASESPPQDADSAGTWLIFADEGGTAGRFAEELRKSGGVTVLVAHGERFQRLAADEFVVNPRSSEDMRRLFLEGGWSSANPLRGVIVCWPLDIPANEDNRNGGGRLPSVIGTEAALHIVQAIAATSALTSGSLILVTRGGVAVNEAGVSDDLCPRAAGFWGMVAAIAIELPELRVRIVDVDPQDRLDHAAALHSESVHRSDARVALRAKRRWVPRLLTYSGNNAASAEQQPAMSAQDLVRDDGTYWITGGMGGLGRETARWLARRGARHLVLTSRQPDEATNRDFLAELSRSSVSYRIFAVDAADRLRMGEIAAEIRRTMPPLRGVIHTAGVIRDAALINQNLVDGDEIRRGKVEGAWILHELTSNIPLDFFVLYSAAGVVLGAAGQGMYAAANAELDALAQFRHRKNLPATSVAWGPWSGAGMAADLVGRGQDVFASRGLAMIDPELGFSLLERLLVDRSPYGAVIPIDWGKFLSRLPRGADRGYYSMLMSAPEPDAADSANVSSPLERLKAIPAGQRHEALVEELASNARQVIGLDDGAPIASTLPLRELGLDSLMAVELRNVLVRLGGQSLPATLLFDYPHLDALSSHLYRVWSLDFDGAPDLATAPSDVPVDRDIAALSDEEAESLLLAELMNGHSATRRR